MINTLEKHYKIIPLNTLKNSHFVLKKPIYITIEKKDDVEAFAYADIEFEAINRLCEEIVTIYEDLKEDRDKLGALPQKWLQYLEEIIEDK